MRPIINELQGERIDLVAWTNESAAFISNALSPAKPFSVQILSHEEKRAEVLVSDDQLALAIGKGGQNVRLAAKLTGWQIDVRSETQKKEAAAAVFASHVDDLSKLEGVGEKTAEVLQKGGWGDIKRLAAAAPSDLTTLTGIGDKTAEKIIESAKAFLAAPPDEPAASEAGEPLSPSEESAPAPEPAVSEAPAPEDSKAPESEPTNQ